MDLLKMVIYLVFALSIIMGAVGALLMKIGAGRIGTISVNSVGDILEFSGKIFTNIPVLGGMTLYFISAALWLYLLTKLDVSVVQPILALTYVVTPILAIFFINESIPALRWIGILVIILGVYVVAYTAS